MCLLNNSEPGKTRSRGVKSVAVEQLVVVVFLFQSETCNQIFPVSHPRSTSVCLEETPSAHA